MLHVREIEPTYNGLRAFVRFPLRLYRGDPNHAQPVIGHQIRRLLGRRNATIVNGVQCFLMAFDGDTPVGRVLAGIDFRDLQRSGERRGYVSLFECVDDQSTANALFDAAKTFLKLNGITSIVGPYPAMFDDFGKGLLVEGFEAGPPALLSPYNPPYYTRLFEGYGFRKERDYLSYKMPIETFDESRYESVLVRAMQRFGYEVKNIDVHLALKKRSREIARVIAESIPAEWDILPPSAEQIFAEFKYLRYIIVPEYVIFAYAGARPVGILIAVPDYAKLLRAFRGRLLPFGWLYFLIGRGRFDRLRAVMQYVVPEYQNKGVEAAMAHRVYEAAVRNGVRVLEGSMVDERNLKGRLMLEKAGGQPDRKYRQYRIDI